MLAPKFEGKSVMTHFTSHLLLIVLLFSQTGLAQISNCDGNTKVRIDCNLAKMVISNGRESHISDIACGGQTGRRSIKPCSIGEIGEGSGKSMLPKGMPMINSDPPGCLCNNCVIHEGRVGSGAHSHGCLHVEREARLILERCARQRPGVKVSMEIIPLKDAGSEPGWGDKWITR